MIQAAPRESAFFANLLLLPFELALIVSELEHTTARQHTELKQALKWKSMPQVSL
jgi:hypothetical protein